MNVSYSTELWVKNNAKDSVISRNNNDVSTAITVLVSLNAGDRVFIRVKQRHERVGSVTILSDPGRM